MIKTIFLQPTVQQTYPFTLIELKKNLKACVQKELESEFNEIFICNFDIYGSEFDYSDDVCDLEETFKKIGFIEGSLIKNSYIMDHEPWKLFSAFNEVTISLEELYREMLFTPLADKVSKKGHVYCIEKLDMDEEYRGSGIGSAVLPQLYFALNHHLSWTTELFVTTISPKARSTRERLAQLDADETRVVDFYLNNGFQPFERNGKYICKYFYMVPSDKYGF